MGKQKDFNDRVNARRKCLLGISLIVMILGGGIFALSVLSRPVLRLISIEFKSTVRWMTNVMVTAGIMQIVTAALSIFIGIWKLMWPTYIGIFVTSLNVFLELVAVGCYFYVWITSQSWVHEDLVHPWYWVECLGEESCHTKMLTYIYEYFFPQMIMSGLTVFLQCVIIGNMARLVKAFTDHGMELHEAHEKYQAELEERRWLEDSPVPLNTNNNNNENNNNNNEKNFLSDEDDEDGIAPADSTFDNVLKTPKRVQFNDDLESSSTPRRRTSIGINLGSPRTEEIEMVHTTTYEAQVHATVDMGTPASILKEDHGYVPGYSVASDYDKI